MGDGNGPSEPIAWKSGEAMKMHGNIVDVYKDYFYASFRWYTKRDIVFTKVYRPYSEGGLVEVTDTFESHSEQAKELSKGLSGVIVKIDDDDDALVKWTS